MPIIPEASADDAQFAIVKRKLNKIFFNGDVSVASCEALRQALEDGALENKTIQIAYSLEQPPPLELHIQSTGGSLMACLGVVDYITSCSVPVHSYVQGYAASAATLIAVVCAKRYAHKNSVVLIHQLSAGVTGQYAAMAEEMKNLELFMSMIRQIYLEHTRISAAEIDEVLKHDIWFSAQECLTRGIVDEII